MSKFAVKTSFITSDTKNRYQVHSGVPIPKRNGSKYPFDEMAVGQCFDVPFDDVDVCTYKPPYSQASAAGIRIAGRKLSNLGVFRIWRVE